MIILVSGPDFGPSDQMFEELKEAPNADEANQTAMDIWAAWMESGSDAADLVMERGVNAQAAGELELARALYDRVIILQPDYAEAWNRRATVFLAENNYPEALRDINEALRLEPRHFGAWAGLGAVLEGLNAAPAAIVAYEEALKIHPNFSAAKSALARLREQEEGRPV
ncbi:MAG: tetratricopeptide repeat protein [Pseudomonadota bacterium]